ncbi:sigma-70 family RNA polymerase sigma factor [Glaciecola sp. MH2013]|uniref:sigma-70 family RNA polymerase sigma factor n=1 Tax=Glaciecola sp. MH2013 TaxID=2785524 RepID=UPI00189F3C2A|nr:sigma-70 family RNA polymerase sigma factor [Glaciecola sp. MH2013]MBF7073339.1 sigma-70 family RNA polymerase sigma factor [Glaciecola sp. MH2013]
MANSDSTSLSEPALADSAAQSLRNDHIHEAQKATANNTASDEDLMGAYATGNLAAFETLYLRHKGSLFRYLLRQVKNQGQAEDLFQEVWAKVIRAASTYRSSAKFTTWLYTIARNKVIDSVRHIKVVDTVEEAPSESTTSNTEGSDDSQTPDLYLKRSRQSSALEHCINNLPRHQLDCFLLKEEGGFSANAISDITEAKLEAIKSRLKSAYKNLRSCLEVNLGKHWEEN